jgi:polysaccharide export outer membrane protein
MRVSRSLLLLLACAFAVAGCAQLPPAQLAAAPPAPAAVPAASIDALAYGAPQPRFAAVPSQAPASDNRGLFAATGPLSRPVAVVPAPAPAVPNRTLYAAELPLPPPAAVAAPRYAPAVTAVGYAPPAAHAAYTLDSGDRLRVVVFGQDGLSNSYLVDASGHIAMPLIGSVSARGLTTDELSSRIAEKLRQGFVREPHVAVEVEAYRPFFILGEVTQPGQYPYVADMTVETAVAIAGGFGPRAYRQTVVVTRMLHGQQVRMTVPTSYPLRPGDTVNVQERWF